MLRVAIVGCGRISSVYKQFFKDLGEEIKLVCAVDKIEEKAKDFASDFKGCSYETKIDSLLNYDIDVLHICLPHNLHSEVSIFAMENGINVLTEKPVSINCSEADEMISVMERTDTLASCIFQTRYIKAVEKIRNTIKSGALGKILGVQSILTWSRQRDYYSGSDWKGTLTGEGGGVLIDQAIHSIDRVRHILDEEVKTVIGKVGIFAHDYLDVEDTASAVVEFESGALYNIYATNTYFANTPISIEFIGTKGKAGLIQDFGYIEIDGVREEIRESYEGKLVGPNYWGSSHDVQIKQFYKAVEDKKLGIKGVDLGVSLEDAKKTLEIIRAIYKSSENNQKIIFPFVEE